MLTWFCVDSSGLGSGGGSRAGGPSGGSRRPAGLSRAAEPTAVPADLPLSSQHLYGLW